MSQAPTVAGWLAAREPAPPPELAERIGAALGPRGAAADRAGAPEACLAAAERVVRGVLEAGPAAERARATALDLLCADALVTYAFEAAAEEPARVGERAAAALARFAALAVPGAA